MVTDCRLARTATACAFPVTDIRLSICGSAIAASSTSSNELRDELASPRDEEVIRDDRNEGLFCRSGDGGGCGKRDDAEKYLGAVDVGARRLSSGLMVSRLLCSS